MLKRLETIINSDFNDLSQRNFLVAVSGGKDSMALVDMLYRIGIRFSIAHCNFSLREEAYTETQLVLNWSRSRDIICYTAYFPTPYLSDEERNIQKLCRQLRYKWFDDLLSTKDLDLVILAHHAGDVRETFFINLARGAGIKGLASIPKYNKSRYRPMLEIEPEAIASYVQNNDVPYLEDSSNQNDKYFRNAIRHTVIPQLESIHPGFQSGLNNSIAFLGEASDYLDDQLSSWEARYVREEGDSLIMDKINEWPHLLLKLALIKRQIPRRIIVQLFEKPWRPDRLFEFHESKLITRQDQIVIVADPTPVSYIIDAPGTYKIGTDGTLRLVGISQPEEITDLTSYEIIVDSDQLRFPLTIRNWREGERIKPIGMKGRSKKISDLLNDYNVNRLAKAHALVLADKRDEIIWVVGYRMSESVKVTNETKNFARIDWSISI